MPRSSPRKLLSTTTTSNNDNDDVTPAIEEKPLKDDTNGKSMVKGKKTSAAAKTDTKQKESPKKRKKAAAKKTNDSDNDKASVASPTKKTKTTKTSDAEKTTATKNKSKGTSSSPAAKKKAKAKKAPVQSLTERDDLPKLWDDDKAKANGSYTLKIATWNVAGLRAIIKKDPEALAKFAVGNDIDILCLQETKLQEMHVDDPKLKIRGHLLEAEGYDSYYSCSVAKKGYSGTAVFVKRRGSAAKATQKDIGSYFATKKPKKGDEKKEASVLPVDEKLLLPEQVSYKLGKEKHDAEGRVIVLDFPGFTMANLYVPNSGQKLDRLSYRTDEWDKDLLAFMQDRQAKRGVPVMWLGDLNVAHKNFEAYNFGAKHLDKQAGLTLQERASFQEQLDAGFIDAFRELHPDAKGHYTYWSQRAGNREPNRGLRLDYFVCDQAMFSDDSKVIARDSYMLPDQLGSDHGPAVLELEIKP